MFHFLIEVKNELAKVVWPTRNETIKYTLTVIIFSIVIAAVLGAFDYLLFIIFQSIINR
jgi:preprotein translocase subunit SecE